MGKPRWSEKRQRWRVRFRITSPDGSYQDQQRDFRTEEKAAAWLAEMEAGINKVRSLEAVGLAHLVKKTVKKDKKEAAAKPQTLTQFAKEFWLWLEQSKASPTTIAGYKSHFKSTVEPVFGGQPLDKILPAHIDALKSELEGINRNTRQPMAVLSSMLSLAVERKKIPFNPCVGRIKRRRTGQAIERGKAPARVLNEKQRQAVVDAMPEGREKVAVMLAAFGGLRLGEVRGLRPGDCHLDEKYIIVANNIVRPIKPPFNERPPKDGEPRLVPLPAQVIKALRPYVKKNRRWVLMQDDGYPLRAESSSYPLYAQLREAQKQAGVELPVSFRDLRATCATIMAAKGVPKAIIKAILGHADYGTSFGPDVTEAHYLRLGANDLVRWVSKLESGDILETSPNSGDRNQ